MNASSNALPDAAVEVGEVAATPAATRPLYWSVRRELWEHRSVYLAPLATAVAGVVLVGVHQAIPPHPMPMVPPPGAGSGGPAVGILYTMLSTLLITTWFLVAAFYSLDALHGERRDRSLLFWKSLPVSDATAVLAKVAVPLVVLPAITFVLTVAAQTVILAATAVVHLAVGGHAPGHLADAPLPRVWLLLLATLPVLALWQAPLYAWFLLVSAWSRRAPLVWALLPMLVLGVFERMAMGTSRVASLLQDRAIGWHRLAFPVELVGGTARGASPPLTPMEALATPGLWFGLVLAAVFLAAAVRLRRDRGPI